MIETTQNSSKPQRALVLSGGGGRGAFECGVIEKLTELGWQPDALVGTSIGSMNAALWALDGTEGVSRMWNEIRTRDMNRFLRLRPWNSLLDRDAWKRTLEKYVPEERLAGVRTPLYIVTTNLRTAHPVVYTNSDYYDHKKKHLYRRVKAINHGHLLASSAIPYLYPPAPSQDDPHWDGAVMYNSPLRPAVHSGAEEIMVVLLSPYHDLLKPGKPLPSIPGGLLGKVGHLLDLAMMATFENDFEQMRRVNLKVRQGGAESDHQEVKAALIGPQKWLSTLAFIRYNRKSVEELRQLGREAAANTWKRIQEHGWDSLQESPEPDANATGPVSAEDLSTRAH